VSNKQYAHRPRKRFGQNFLTDQSIVEKILKALAPNAGDTLIEIGPGQGALTELLLSSGAQVHAIEIDRDLAAYLREQFGGKSNFSLHENDVLKVDFNSLLSHARPARIIGNLPYNISTPLIFHLLNYLPGISDMLFMLQLEVVDRMAATPNSKIYGRLSVMVQYLCKVEPLFKVPATAFSPAPKVESAIVKLTPHKQAPFASVPPEELEKLLRQAFAHRRKTLRNNLNGIISSEELTQLSIDPGKRPENLSLEDYVRICKYLNSPIS
tara:strand:+ start:2106 stop:2909 length:804 start_codon:yes stop_codon:yes gene_type:complete